MPVPTDEQETIVGGYRTEDLFDMYTSDTTFITKLDKLCKSNPDYYRCIKETPEYKRYTFPKSLLTFRKSPRALTDEQRAVCAERLALARQKHSESSVD